MDQKRIVFIATMGELAEVPSAPFAYWAPNYLRILFKKLPPLDRDVANKKEKRKLADVKQGLATANEPRFTRLWWEVSVSSITTNRDETLSKKWVPFSKGSKLFFYDIINVVNWGKDGEEVKSYIIGRYPYLKGNWEWVAKNNGFYFCRGLRIARAQSWSKAAQSRRLAAVFMPLGSIFDARSMAVIIPNGIFSILGFLLSRVANILVFLQCGEPAGEVSHIAQIPITPDILNNKTLSDMSQESHDLLAEWATGEETATIFCEPWLLQVQKALQRKWDESVIKPSTGHPLSYNFTWSEWESANRIRHWLPEASAILPFSLISAAKICVKREALLRQQIAENQAEIDKEVYQLYNISAEDRALIEAELGQAVLEGESIKETESEVNEGEDAVEEMPEGLFTDKEHIRRLIHYFLHEIVKADADGIVPLHDTYMPDGRLESGLNSLLNQRLVEIFGAENLETCLSDLLEAFGMPLEEWIETEFFQYHVTFYRLRPILWQIVSRCRGKPVFSCLVYLHKLDADTLRKIQQVYLRPLVESARQESQRLGGQLIGLRESGTPLHALREAERVSRLAEERWNELRSLQEHIQALLQPHTLIVQSRSAWVIEKVNEIVSHGYQPELDYGVRVNIEPLKQAGILPQAADRIKG